MDGRTALKRLTGGLVVSCQAREGNPLHGPSFMAAMAQAAVLGGAVGIRANGADDVSAIRQAIGPDIPIMGIAKETSPDGSVFITPSVASVEPVMAAGAALIALDGTHRPRPGGESLATVIAAIQAAGGAALADIDTLESARYAVSCGADAVGTTLSGYTPDSRKQQDPDFDLLSHLAAELDVPVFAEGRFWTPEQAARALTLGASFVVIGTAITNPLAITERFIQGLAVRQR